MNSKVLVDYLYVDESRLECYIQQSEADKALFFSWTWFTSSKYLDRYSINEKVNTHKRVLKLLRYLRKTNQLLTKRPLTYGDNVFHPEYFYCEKLKAIKLTLEIPRHIKFKELTHLTFWISYPLNLPSSKDSVNVYREDGMFLYLVQDYWGSDANSHILPYSGYTSLRHILEEISGNFETSLREIKRCLHRDSRDTTDSIDVLKRIGFVVQEERVVTALYRKRFVSDDKYVNVDGELHRCSDIFAYPVAIWSD